MEHIWGKHGIEVRKYGGDSVLSPEVFLCSEDGCKFQNIRLFLGHVDKVHGIHIWYEKGLTKKTVFFDGTLEAHLARTESDRTATSDSSKSYVPLSKRPYEPRKKTENSEEDSQKLLSCLGFGFGCSSERARRSASDAERP